ncbi:hypothetical protein OIU76_013043 [Salix suchowensis]|nr:hypothetical protein OIU76_013043 [Salix suchowensis]
MEGILVLDSENINVAGNNIKGEKLGKGLNQDGKSQSVIVGKDYIEKVQREIMTLTKIVVDRNKTIEFSAIELQKLRIRFQQLQQKNQQLAQKNSHMLDGNELNAGKDKLKVFQHELGCKNGLLSARNLELKEKAKKVRCRIMRNEIETIKGDGAAQLFKPEEENKPCNPKRKRQSKVQSLGTRSSLEKKSPLKTTLLQRDTLLGSSLKKNNPLKRTMTKREGSVEEINPSGLSPRHKVEEPTEDLFQTDDARFHVPPIHGDPVHESCPTLSTPSVKTESETGNSALRFETQEPRRTSLRPSRRAAEKVQSYKEIPLNVKIRRGG